MCPEHQIELSLVCKPCNKTLCYKCLDTSHQEHDVKTIESVVKMEKDLLLCAGYFLKSKVHALEGTSDIAKIEAVDVGKKTDRVKYDIRDHATQLKNIFCKTVDIFMNINIENAEKDGKAHTKRIEYFLDETERSIVSLSNILKITELILKENSELEFLGKVLGLKRRLDELLPNIKSSVAIFDINYNAPGVDLESIKQMVGCVESVKSKEVEPYFRDLPIPDLKIVNEMTKKSSFTSTNIKCIVSGNTHTIWILDNAGRCTELNSQIGTQSKCISVENNKNNKLLKMADGRVLIFSGSSAKLLNNHDNTRNVFEVPFDDGIACCCLQNGNLLVYNDTDKSLVEVQEQEKDIKRTLRNDSLSEKLGQGLQVVCTSGLNLIILINNHVITTNSKGDIINSYKTGYNLSGICIDKYDNVFVGDTSRKQVHLYTPQGVYKKNVLFLGGTINANSTLLAFDGYGNLCVWNSAINQIQTFSYL